MPQTTNELLEEQMWRCFTSLTAVKYAAKRFVKTALFTARILTADYAVKNARKARNENTGRLTVE